MRFRAVDRGCSMRWSKSFKLSMRIRTDVTAGEARERSLLRAAPSRLLAILSIGLLGLASVSMMIGPASLSLSDLGESLSGQLTSEHPSSIIFWQLRLPRIITACLVGSSLAIAGVAFQSLFRNPLAEPYVIGASSGAALGVALVAVSGWQVACWDGSLGRGGDGRRHRRGAVCTGTGFDRTIHVHCFDAT